MSIPNLMLSLRRGEPISLGDANAKGKTSGVNRKSKEVAEELLKQLGGRDSDNESAQVLYRQALKLSPRGQQRLRTDLETAMSRPQSLKKESKQHWEKVLERIDQNVQCNWKPNKRWKSITDLEAAVEHPLHAALDIKDYTLLAELIGAGANVEDHDATGQTLLQRAVTQLSGMDPEDKERPSLQLLCEQLLSAGAIPEQSLHQALNLRDPAHLEQLIAQGADLELLDGEPDEGYTALQRVMLELAALDESDADYGKLMQIYELLTRAKANPNAVSFTHAHTVIHRALEELPWSPARIYRLLELGVDAGSWNSRGHNALHALLAQEPEKMAEAGQILVIKGIIERFGTPELVRKADNFEMTPLHHLVANPKLAKGSMTLVDALDKLGADIYAVDRAGRSPLYLAVEAKLPDAVLIESLLSKGANPEQTTFGTHSPLAEAKERLALCSDDTERERLEWVVERFQELADYDK